MARDLGKSDRFNENLLKGLPQRFFYTLTNKSFTKKRHIESVEVQGALLQISTYDGPFLKNKRRRLFFSKYRIHSERLCQRTCLMGIIRIHLIIYFLKCR